MSYNLLLGFCLIHYSVCTRENCVLSGFVWWSFPTNNQPFVKSPEFNSSFTQIKKWKVSRSGFCSHIYLFIYFWPVTCKYHGHCERNLRLNFKMTFNIAGNHSLEGLPPHNSCFVKLALSTAAEFLSFLGDGKLRHFLKKTMKALLSLCLSLVDSQEWLLW